MGNVEASTTTHLPQTPHRFGSPSGVREEMVIAALNSRTECITGPAGVNIDFKKRWPLPLRCMAWVLRIVH